jgi:hypothetical protein
MKTSRAALPSLIVAALALAACGQDLDPEWQLDHDRIIAIRATPPSIATGETSRIDALLAVKGSTTEEREPEVATVISPQALADTLLPTDEGGWVVTAPGDDQLAAAREELGLDPGVPVPLQIGVAYNGMTLAGIKSVTLGIDRANPDLPPVMIDGTIDPAPDAEIVIGKLVDVPMSVDAAETDDVSWLTSCGTMHDEDLPMAHIRVEVEDPTEGQLAVVLRDENGGVTWQVWNIRAE